MDKFRLVLSFIFICSGTLNAQSGAGEVSGKLPQQDITPEFANLNQRLNEMTRRTQNIFPGVPILDLFSQTFLESARENPTSSRDRIHQRFPALIVFANQISEIVSFRTFELGVDFAFGQSLHAVIAERMDEFSSHIESLDRHTRDFSARLIQLDRQIGITATHLRDRGQLGGSRLLGNGVTGSYRTRFQESMQQNIQGLARVASNMGVAAFESPSAPPDLFWVDGLRNVQDGIHAYLATISNLEVRLYELRSHIIEAYARIGHNLQEHDPWLGQLTSYSFEERVRASEPVYRPVFLEGVQFAIDAANHLARIYHMPDFVLGPNDGPGWIDHFEAEIGRLHVMLDEVRERRMALKNQTQSAGDSKHFDPEMGDRDPPPSGFSL